MNRPLSKRGFTLIEMMIVVTIIGLLAMMAIPAFGRSRTRTQKTICQNNQRIIFEQMNVYCIDQSVPLTTVTFPNLCAARDALTPASKSQRYIKDRRVFSCPGNDDQTVQHDYDYLTSGQNITGLRCGIVNTHN